jgi:hypothetical protein
MSLRQSLFHLDQAIAEMGQSPWRQTVELVRDKLMKQDWTLGPDEPMPSDARGSTLENADEPCSAHS